MQQQLNFDICENRHLNNAQSVEANRRASGTKLADREIIIRFLKLKGTGHAKQFALFLNKQLNAVSPRCSELLRDGIIERTGEVAEGCAIYQLKT
ncbi:MAG: hypothetical protein M3367_03295 [Acidobacteriota bacterium]|nr:hypothetical protein [Acidobacteriota bacterium]